MSRLRQPTVAYFYGKEEARGASAAWTLYTSKMSHPLPSFSGATKDELENQDTGNAQGVSLTANIRLTLLGSTGKQRRAAKRRTTTGYGQLGTGK